VRTPTGWPGRMRFDRGHDVALGLTVMVGEGKILAKQIEEETAYTL